MQVEFRQLLGYNYTYLEHQCGGDKSADIVTKIQIPDVHNQPQCIARTLVTDSPGDDQFQTHHFRVHGKWQTKWERSSSFDVPTAAYDSCGS